MVKLIELKTNKNDLEKIYSVKIGENAQENWDLITESDQSDIWFHLESHPSPHVILKTEGIKLEDIDKHIIFMCSVECKNRSKLKLQKNVYVIYTQIKNVAKADEVGSVHTKKIKRICIG
jgi:predicted ribosome quality control (RQC) complex YloA/Tae2 family protein